MRRLVFERKNVGVSQDVSTEVPSGNQIGAIDVRYSGTYTSTGAGGGGNLDTAFGQMGRVEFKVGSRPIVDMDAIDFRHVTAAIAHEYAELNPVLSILDTTAGGQNGPAPFTAQGRLDFQAVLDRPDVYVNALTEKPTLRVRTRAANYMGTTVATIDGELHAYADALEKPVDPARGYFEPFFHQDVKELSIGSAIPFTKTFSEPLLLVGFFVRCLDESTWLGGNPNLARSDTLIRELSMTHKRNGSHETLIPPTRWYDLNQNFGRKLGIGTVRDGVAYWDFDDPETPEQEALLVYPGEELYFTLDTAGTTDKQNSAVGSTSSVVAAGDQAIFTWLAFRPVGFNVRLRRAAQ